MPHKCNRSPLRAFSRRWMGWGDYSKQLPRLPVWLSHSVEGSVNWAKSTCTCSCGSGEPELHGLVFLGLVTCVQWCTAPLQGNIATLQSNIANQASPNGRVAPAWLETVLHECTMSSASTHLALLPGSWRSISIMIEWSVTDATQSSHAFRQGLKVKRHQCFFPAGAHRSAVPAPLRWALLWAGAPHTHFLPLHTPENPKRTYQVNTEAYQRVQANTLFRSRLHLALSCS